MAHREDSEDFKEFKEKLASGLGDYERDLTKIEMEGLMRGMPFPQDKLEEFENSVKWINELCAPTVQGLSDKENILELQNQVFKTFLPIEKDFNNCLYQARNMTAATWCTNQLITKIDTEVKEKVIKILNKF
mgnify:CR=1 FL=1